MAERNLPATAHRIRHARRAGRVAHSPALTAIVGIIAGAAALWANVDRLAAAFAHGLARAVASASGAVPPNPGEALQDALRDALAVLAPVLLAAFAAASIAGAVQTGFLFAPAAATAERGSAAQSLVPKWGEALRQLAMGFALLAMGWACMRAVRPWFLTAARGTPQAELEALASTVRATVARLVGLALALGMMDLLYRRWQYARSMRMSHDEMLRENRDDEGDPEVRAARKRVWHEGQSPKRPPTEVAR